MSTCMLYESCQTLVRNFIVQLETTAYEGVDDNDDCDAIMILINLNLLPFQTTCREGGAVCSKGGGVGRTRRVCPRDLPRSQCALWGEVHYVMIYKWFTIFSMMWSTKTPVCPIRRDALCDLQVVHYLPNEKRYVFCDLLAVWSACDLLALYLWSTYDLPGP